jgi:2-aminoadipate transaminase
MRLNFSASNESEIEEGIRRIGEVVWEQVNLYETLTGHPTPPAPHHEEIPEGGDVVPLRKRAEGGQ